MSRPPSSIRNPAFIHCSSSRMTQGGFSTFHPEYALVSSATFYARSLQRGTISRREAPRWKDATAIRLRNKSTTTRWVISLSDVWFQLFLWRPGAGVTCRSYASRQLFCRVRCSSSPRVGTRFLYAGRAATHNPGDYSVHFHAS